MDKHPAAHRPPQLRRFGALGGPLLIVALALGGGMVAGCTDHASAPAPTGDAPAAEAAPSSGVQSGVPSSPASGVATEPASVPMPASGAASTHVPAPAAEASVPAGHVHMPTADEVTATWKARPDYVKALPPDWEGAYAYALSRPDVIQWLPCYCGCTGMGHRSNLDCFFQRREVEGNYAFEEHASYCDICVETANMASAMLREGSTMVQIRAAVDATFGDRAPGTETPLPPF
jgi:hypothetical protein